MDIDDKELFSSAMTADEIPEAETETPAEAPAPETPPQDERPRDEHGRFAPKQAAGSQSNLNRRSRPASLRQRKRPTFHRGDCVRYARKPKGVSRKPKRSGNVSLKCCNGRTSRSLNQRLRPDLFENPQGAIEYGAQAVTDADRAAIQAMEAKVQEDREANSQYFAIQQHGAGDGSECL